MERWIGKVAVVTGTSSGIGKAIAENLVAEGLKVVGIARRKDNLDALSLQLKGKKGTFYPKAGDVTKETELLSALEWVENTVGPISILVNNAGVYRGTTLTETSSKSWREVLDTNVLALSIATKDVVNRMKKNKIDGHIVNINSIAGHRCTGVIAGMYTASKYAVTALSETLHFELAREGSKIKVSSVSPGAVLTNIMNAAGDSVRVVDMESYAGLPFLSADDVAKAVNYVLSTPPNVEIQELTIKPVGETN